MAAFEVLDAAATGTVELAHTCSYYFANRDPAFAIGTALPFGLNSRLQNAWLEGGDGNAVLNDFYRTHGVVGLPCGNTGCQMGGWFKDDLTSVDGLQGLRMRVAGITGSVLASLGVVPRPLPGSEIVPALQDGRIDAAEWVGPYDDEKLGFDRVAKYYFYPGWWEPSTTLHLFVNAEAWDTLPEPYRQACIAAAGYANGYTMAKYDVQNPAALKRLVQKGVVLRPFPRDVLEQAQSASEAIYAQFREESPAFRELFEHWEAFRGDGYLWWLVNEIAMDAFMVRSRATRG